MPKPPSKDLRVYIGVDPGITGGITVLHKGEVDAYKMPTTYVGMLGLVEELTSLNPNPGNTVCVLEKVGGYIPSRKKGKEGTGQPGSAMFVFGEVYGAIKMSLIACGLVEDETLLLVRPQTWQRTLQVKPCDHKNGETKPQFKRRLVQLACVTFPRNRVIAQVADSMLIAKYCKKIFNT